MTDDLQPPRGGAAGLWLLFCAVGGGAGLAFDLILNPGRGFWLGAEPGARAVIGAAVALFAAAAAYIIRAVLARRVVSDAKGERRVGDNP